LEDIMKKTIFVAAVAAAVFSAPHFASASGNRGSGEYHGGFDIGPLGQCFNPPDCGRHEDINGYDGRGSYGQSCPIVRERVVTPKGKVIYQRRRACY
jgi:hypothetical protein